MATSTTEVLVLGAGPYGISLGSELHRRGVPFVVVGEPFSLWLDHVLSGVSLRSDVNTSEVFSVDDRFSLRRHLNRTLGRAGGQDAARRRISVEVFRGYARAIVRCLPFAPVRDRAVHLAPSPGGGFEATLAGGDRIHANRVVVATGVESHRHLPACLAPLPRDRVVHSYETHRYEGLKDRRVLVLGGGQSAAETVVHLAPANRVTWAHRGRLRFYAEPINVPRLAFRAILRASAAYRFLPTWLRRPAGSTFVASTITPDLRPAVLHRGVDRRVSDAADLGLEARGDAVHAAALGATFDVVVAATGYRYSLATLGFLDEALQPRMRTWPSGAPRLHGDFSSSIPGLHFVGGLAEPSLGPGQRFMFGCRQATLAVSRAIAAS